MLTELSTFKVSKNTKTQNQQLVEENAKSLTSSTLLTLTVFKVRDTETLHQHGI